ncbi:unnamed protein product [Echinostoma caproni]|uniref:ascorbate ferrireductase (transmembrane) n=1 Tax=Echinostoma caproni TaxID=27848 RepID=A0A183AD72_9TREM|nr:unnamed protein product [Echinostoma caproni]
MPPVFLSWFLDLAPSILVLTVCTFVLPPRTLFDWHPLLVAIGGTLIMPWAIRALDRDMSWIAQKPRASKIQWHWVLQLFGATLICVGAAAVFVNKNLYGKPHYATWHGLLGLITVVFVLAVALAGFALHWKVWPIGHLVSHGTARVSHMYFGLGLISLIGVTTGFGLSSHWLTRQLSDWVGEGVASGLIIPLTGIAMFPAVRTLLQVCRYRFRQVATKPK